ncbi:MAG: DNA polymerase Y family protein, partial [Pseudonocardia sp.]
PLPVELVAVDGSPVRLTAPDLLSAVPQHVAVDGGEPRPVTGWAGPWPVRQRWWTGNPEASRLQVVVDDGEALLLLASGGRWWLTGRYD